MPSSTSFMDFLEHLREQSSAGTYAGVRFSRGTIKEIIELQDKLAVPNPLTPDKFHSTLLFSRKHLPTYVAYGRYIDKPRSDSGEFELRVFESASGKRALVLCYDCQFLERRHKYLMDLYGGTWDYPSYIPHITLSYDIGDSDMELGAIRFATGNKIVIDSEYQNELDLNWS